MEETYPRESRKLHDRCGVARRSCDLDYSHKCVVGVAIPHQDRDHFGLSSLQAYEIDVACIDHDEKPVVEHSPRQTVGNHGRSCLRTA
ncbi:hypothetical protein PC128_g14519 [Phytophthora cactorum]|nr:hypothetical protein PC128_g14519 [Phytophthora cactorum]